MNFDFSDDEQQLRDAVQRWVDRGYGFERRRAIARAGGFSAEAWTELAELGLLGLGTAEADGGMDLGPVAAMLALEAL
ncbi:MAG TPA: acyl-CoA dehydrogenase family protein, partial [Burkholderiaceae bacterium]